MDDHEHTPSPTHPSSGEPRADDLPETTLRAAATGIVRDVAGWRSIPRVGLGEKMRYVVRGRRIVWVLGIVVAATVAYLAITWIARRAQRACSPPAQPPPPPGAFPPTLPVTMPPGSFTYHAPVPGEAQKMAAVYSAAHT